MEKIGLSHGAREASTGIGVCWAGCGGNRPPSSLPPFLPPQLVVPKLPSSYHKLSYEVGFDIVITKCQKKFA